MAVPRFFRPPISSLVASLMILLIAGGMGYIFMNMPDNRTPSQKMSDAAKKLSDGVSGAAKTLGDQPPADRAKDEVKAVGDKARDTAN